MTSYTDDELRQIYTFLPLDQEPTPRNIQRYINFLDDNFKKEQREIDEEWSKWKQDVNYDQINQQYHQLWVQLSRLIDVWKRQTSKMVALTEYKYMIPTSYEDIERNVLNTPEGYFNYSD